MNDRAIDSVAIWLLEKIWPMAYLAVALVQACLTLVVLNQPVRSRPFAVAATANITAFVAAMFLLAVMHRASATVQFNVGNAGAMQAWSEWVSLWPICMLTLLAASLAAIAAVAEHVVLCWQPAGRKRLLFAASYLGLTIVHCFLALLWVAVNAPRA